MEMGMLKDALKMIKSEKKLSFSHWRYRLLHWTFGINPTSTHDSYLPSYLYTHYCPVFHLTNLMAVMLPFIAVFKVFWAVSKVVGYFAVIGLEMLCNVVDNVRSIYKQKSKEKEVSTTELTEEQKAKLKKKEERYIYSILIDAYKDREKYPLYYKSVFNFEVFFNDRNNNFVSMSREEVERKWTEVRDKILAAEEIAKEKRELLKQRIAFWVNVSRVVIKSALNLFYVTLVLAIVYAVSVWGLPAFWVVAKCVWWLTVGFFSFAWVVPVFQVLFSVGVMLAVIVGLSKVAPKVAPKVLDTVVVTPWNIFVDANKSALNKFVDVCTCVIEFIEVFYEENCPPVTIVDEGEADIAKLEGE